MNETLNFEALPFDPRARDGSEMAGEVGRAWRTARAGRAGWGGPPSRRPTLGARRSRRPTPAWSSRWRGRVRRPRWRGLWPATWPVPWEEPVVLAPPEPVAAP